MKVVREYTQFSETQELVKSIKNWSNTMSWFGNLYLSALLPEFCFWGFLCLAVLGSPAPCPLKLPMHTSCERTIVCVHAHLRVPGPPRRLGVQALPSSMAKE